MSDIKCRLPLMLMAYNTYMWYAYYDKSVVSGHSNEILRDFTQQSLLCSQRETEKQRKRERERDRERQKETERDRANKFIYKSLSMQIIEILTSIEWMRFKKVKSKVLKLNLFSVEEKTLNIIKPNLNPI